MRETFDSMDRDDGFDNLYNFFHCFLTRDGQCARLEIMENTEFLAKFTTLKENIVYFSI